jgi:hypothetical protein
MRLSFHLFLLRRWEARRQAAWALLDGRLTLRQAAARFRDIDAELPYEARGRRPPQYTEEEWPYRQVLSYVHTELVARRGAPAQAEAWVARLEAEMRGHLRGDAASRSQQAPTGGRPKRNRNASGIPRRTPE